MVTIISNILELNLAMKFLNTQIENMLYSFCKIKV